MKKNFTLEFEQMPKLIFISECGNPRGNTLYIDGEEVTGIQSLVIQAGVDRVVTHEISFVTRHAGRGGR